MASAGNTNECLEAFQQHHADVDKISFGILLKAYAKEGRAVEAEQLLQRQIDLWEQTNNVARLQPDRISFTTVMDAWSRSGLPEAVVKTQNLLERLQCIAARDSNPLLQPDVVTYTSVIHSAPTFEEACMLLQQMWERYDAGSSTVQPNRRTYASVMNKARTRDQVLHAETLLHAMRTRHVDPTSITYNTILNAWSKSGAYDAPERIEAWLECMERDYAPLLDSGSYNVAITTWAKSGRPDAVPCVERLVDRMFDIQEVDPDIVTYSCLVDLYSRNKQAQKATELLYRVCDAYVSGFSKVPPNSVIFATVISAWSKSDDDARLVQARAVLARMKDMNLPPTTAVYNTFLTACNQDPIIAIQYLQEMKQHSYSFPNAISYTTIVKALSTTTAATTNKMNMSHTAFELFQDMLASNIEPDVIFYSTLLNVLSKSADRHSLSKAESVMEEMTKNQSNSTPPNLICYNCFLKCIARSRDKNKAKRALDLVNSMIQNQGIEPSIMTWNEVLAACAYSDTYDVTLRNVAFDIARHVLLDRIVAPSSHSYAHFFQAAAGISNSSDDVERAYVSCWEQGLANNTYVIRNVQKVAPHLIK